MGLSFKSLFHSVSSILPSGGGQRTAILGGLATIGATAFGGPQAGAAVGGLVQNLNQRQQLGDETIPDTGPQPQTMPGTMPAMGMISMGARMAPAVFNAIVKLSQRLGGAGRSVAGYGARVWAQLSSWAAKNPGVSLVSLLVSLGLTVEEAAHFIAWGTAHKRHARGRGISSRDLRTTRRTVRKVISMQRNLAQLCGGMPHRVHHRRQHRA